jgi:hypothetical protein
MTWKISERIKEKKTSMMLLYRKELLFSVTDTTRERSGGKKGR